MNKQIEKTAVLAAKEAGRALLKEYENFNRQTVRLKSSHEILTRADLLSEEIILKEIRRNFPMHGILSEEMGSAPGQSEYLWTVDPLDGTTNFSLHSPLWAISIALSRGDEILFGLVYAPRLEEMYLAFRNEGARLNGRGLKVSDMEKGKILNAFCHGRQEKDLKRAIKYFSRQKLNGFDCRQLGSAALELAYVAAGRLESIVIPGANSWDVAAGVLLVREAGGKVTDFSGRQWYLDSQDMLASNSHIHQDLLKAVKGL